MNAHIIGLYTTIYHVADLASAKRWYARMLDLQPYFDQPFYVGFNVAGHELGLLPQADTKRQGLDTVAYWGVLDIAAACKSLETLGHELFEPVTEVGEGIRVASFLDPDGHIIGLIENPHFPNTAEPPAGV